MSSSRLHVQSYTGHAIEPFIPALANLRIRIFRDFPYLYEGSPAYEAEYLQHYSCSPQSVIVIAFEADRIIGASTGMPMPYYGADVMKPFVENGYDPARIFYFGESVLDHAWRGYGLGGRFFDEREAHARREGFEFCCFCAVERPLDHPRRPADYRPLDPFWNKRGYRKHSELVTHFSWKDLDEPVETDKPLVFWLKSLQG